jgi:hypothetical protein
MNVARVEGLASQRASIADLWHDLVAHSAKFCFANTAGCLVAYGNATGTRAKSNHQQKLPIVLWRKQNPVCRPSSDFSASQ